ncbi:hypothetical protein WJX74_003308 [Apatococcus lobatus]|uniref:Major facilitator superfamily (MFS) profile domain-containing protein n=1 Tax=Apatococcus lobatus TaxID=904363 RepID=A0AAW1RA29_9CHLO
MICKVREAQQGRFSAAKSWPSASLSLVFCDEVQLQSAQDCSVFSNWRSAFWEVVVSSAVAAAAAGAALGGIISDRLGRLSALLLADALFSVGGILMAASPSFAVLTAGRVTVGLGIGIASVTVPVYIAEASRRQHRASLVSVNVLAITGGQFLAYVVDFLCTYLPGTWRWMLGVSIIPAAVQLYSILGNHLLESPSGWLDKDGCERHSRESPWDAGDGDDRDDEHVPLQGAAMDADGRRNEGTSPELGVWGMLRTPVLAAELKLGLGLQALQQAAGINTVMYFAPTILGLAGFQSPRSAVLASIVPAAVNALGTIVGMRLIDRAGRRKLMLGSLMGVVAALLLLGAAFRLAESSSPSFTANPGHQTCPLPEPLETTCSSCIRQGCNFCEPEGADDPAACLEAHRSCPGGSAQYTSGCPSPYTSFVLMALLLYLAAFSTGVSPVPWAVNAEIYPLEVRGVAGGAAATVNWLTNALVAQTFLTLTQWLGASGAFWLYALIALAGLVWVYWTLPETSGLSLQSIQDLFASSAIPRGSSSLASSGRGVSQADEIAMVVAS